MSTELKLEFEPRTIEHLGLQMYSQLPNAIAELVANSFDADAREVTIQILEVDGAQEILVIDDGHGMSTADLATKYLRIGRNRRMATDAGKSESGRRLVSGKKGIGKLALFGIGTRIQLETKRKGVVESNVVTLDWEQMLNSEGDYYPEVRRSSKPAAWSGTIIALAGLRRSTKIDAKALARSLSRLFNYSDSDFSITVRDMSGAEFPVGLDLRFDSDEIELEWEVPGSFGLALDKYFDESGIRGKIVASTKPLRQSMRGITLYANGRLINEPEFFGAAESSFAYSYLSGHIEVDFLDDIVPDVVATDRRAINWDAEETIELRLRLTELLTSIAGDWRKERSRKKRERAEKRQSKSFEEWTSTVKGPERAPLQRMLTAIVSSDVDIPEGVQDGLVADLEQLAPPFADLLWRHLHPDVQDPAKADYEIGRYFHAVDEAIKRYITDVEAKFGMTNSSAHSLLMAAFGKPKEGSRSPKLHVFKKYLDVVDNRISSSTAENVEEGQRYLSVGLIAAVRNPLAHQEKDRLLACGAFTHEDCLDALSLLSHLRRRLDDAVLV